MTVPECPARSMEENTQPSSSSTTESNQERGEKSKKPKKLSKRKEERILERQNQVRTLETNARTLGYINISDKFSFETTLGIHGSSRFNVWYGGEFKSLS